jgi:RNA polymerase-binding transcription factor DksA
MLGHQELKQMAETTLRTLELREMLIDRRHDEHTQVAVAGVYGRCVECGRDIAERRLGALPFAARCQACVGRREHLHGQAERLSRRRDRLALYSDVVCS